MILHNAPIGAGSEAKVAQISDSVLPLIITKPHSPTTPGLRKHVDASVDKIYRITTNSQIDLIEDASSGRVNRLVTTFVASLYSLAVASPHQGNFAH